MTEMFASFDKKKLIISLILNALIFIFELVALSITLKQKSSFIQFYTQDSNLFALLTSFLCLAFSIYSLATHSSLPVWVKSLKYFSTCCLTVTFLVVVVILAPIDGVMYGNVAGAYKNILTNGNMLYHHLLCPILAIVSFVFFEKEPLLGRQFVLYAMIPTLIYAVVIVILNIAKLIVGPYPFLHVYEQPVYMSLIWGFVVLSLAFLINWGVWKLNAIHIFL